MVIMEIVKNLSKFFKKLFSNGVLCVIIREYMSVFMLCCNFFCFSVEKTSDYKDTNTIYFLEEDSVSC